MKQYHVLIEETVVGQFVIEADDEEKAMAAARARYRAGAYALEPGELVGASLAVVGRDGEVGPWEEL